MIAATSSEDFLASPEGRYCLVGGKHIVFCHSPSLYGHVSWGRPEVEDVRELVRLCAVGVRPSCSPHAWLVDLRALELIDPGTFGVMLEYVRSNAPVLARNITRQAQLRPDGMVGAVISGFSQIARLPYPERVFSDIEEALSWLEVPRVLGLDLLAELDDARSGAQRCSSVVARLRAELDEAGALSLDQIARRLGLSARTLQRALGEGGTSYRAELRSFRVRRAQSLLRAGDRSLASIATEIGFSSVQHFTTAFRLATGETPGAWRARSRSPQR